MFATALPVQASAKSEPTLIPSIDLYFGHDTFITLTNVYEHYVQFHYRGMAIYMGHDGTITFNSPDTPYVPGLGQILPGVAIPVSAFSDAFGGGAVSFNMGWCADTNSNVFPSYMELIGGRYQWVKQIMFFRYATIEDHRAAMEYYDTRSLLIHVLPQQEQHSYDVITSEVTRAPIIPSITIRPPDLAEDDDLEVTFANAYDAIGFADIMMQSARWFYLAPNGSVSFNRDMELTSFNPYDGETIEVINLPAGEVFYVYGHEAVSFFWMYYPVYCCHFDFEPGVYGTRGFAFNVREQQYGPWWPDGKGRLTYFAVSSDTPRILRFAIDQTTFTDNGVPHTLEAAPFIANDRTMVPLRVIVEALGATDLDFTDGMVSFVLFGETITMTIGEALGNMGTPVIIADRTFVPLAFIMLEVGAEVSWDEIARAAYVFID